MGTCQQLISVDTPFMGTGHQVDIVMLVVFGDRSKADI